MQLGDRGAIIYSGKQHLIIFISCFNNVCLRKGEGKKRHIKGSHFLISEEVKRFKGHPRERKMSAETGE